MHFTKNQGIRLIALTLSATLLCGCSSGNSGSKKGNTAETTAPTQEQQKELSVPELLKAVLTLKSDLKASVEALGDQETSASAERLTTITEKTDTVRRSLDATLQNMGNSLPAVQNQLENIRNILDLVDTLNEQILQPATTMLSENPLDDLSSDEGFQVESLKKYIDFAESIIPAAENLVEQAQTVDLSVVDSDGDLQEKLEKAEKFVQFYHENPNALATLKTMLGMEGNRTYLLAAQGPAEIRASGGFPGAMGVMRIQDGILSVQDFRSVYDVLSSYTPAEANITLQETGLFHGGMTAPRDADFCPDFERVAYIWALGYETQQHEPVDGVITLAPVMVQRLLAALDEEITLFDGLTMDGTNACRVLQYDLYFKYFGRDYVPKRELVSDQLFADAAQKAMFLMFDHTDGQALSGYLDVVAESTPDRTLMFWMKDENEQAIIRELGWHGGLNSDPEEPAAGVYVNCTIASKMGIFLEMDTQAGERTLNADGSYTYPIQVTFRNSITTDEINSASSYITGGSGGYFGGSAFFFAPAGGTISNFATNGNVYIREENYQGLDLGFMQNLQLSPDQSLVVTYDVTTAPGVEKELTFSKTPTLQDYR